MNYQVLARKWRPKTFNDVVGQEHTVIILTNSLSVGNIHHAYLFSGTRGVGKTSIARLLVKGLNCKTGITSMPCGVCNNCYEIEQGRFIDLIEVDAASRTKVEDTRDLLNNIQYSPAKGRFTVYLMDEVHMLSRHSFNALLKVLEEPPSHVKFILATTDPQKLPITILSRCLQFHLKILSIEQIQHRIELILNKEKIEYESHAIQLLAHAADGSLRDALSLTDQAIASSKEKITSEIVNAMLGNVNKDQTLSLIEAIIESNGERVMILINEIASYGIDWELLLIEMQSLLYRIAMVQLSPDLIEEEDAIKFRILKLAHTVPPTDIQLFYQTFLIGRKELSFAPNRRMGVEMTLLRALAFHPKTSLLKKKLIKHRFSSMVSKEPSKKLTEMSSKISYLDITNRVLSARNQLQRKQEITKFKKNGSVLTEKELLINNAVFKRLEFVKKCVRSRSTFSSLLQMEKKKPFC